RGRGPPRRGLFESGSWMRGGQLVVRGGQLPPLAGPVYAARGVFSAVGRWFEERAGLGGAFTPALDHPVPSRTASWWYTFGSATLALFVLQIATGICLAFVYVPSADEAYKSLQYLNYEAPFGWYLRAVHFWASTRMVALMT